ncbi:SRPBCC family protein [Geodermatophilus maliterrae]|uniref:SRPBCC family protein n=1 Tax=Geodermatophilus maliterrae TaxID=3162531 RepID=A0ABV3XCV9_9ACTN
MEQSTRIDVEAPVQQVWQVLREVELWPEWAPTVTSVRRLDDGPLAVGSRVRVGRPRILRPSTW